jgi:hypothetical protein
MADKETRTDAKEEGNAPGRPDSDDIKIPGSTGGSLPEAMVHRDSHSPQTKADK